MGGHLLFILFNSFHGFGRKDCNLFKQIFGKTRNGFIDNEKVQCPYHTLKLSHIWYLNLKIKIIYYDYFMSIMIIF